MENNNKNNEVIDFTEISEKYSGKWVILSNNNEVLKSGDTFDDIIEFIDLGITMLVPNINYTFSPSN